MSEANVALITIVGLGTAAETIKTVKGATVGDVLAQAALDATGLDIRVNGEKAKADTVLNDDAVVAALPNVEGGC